METTNKTFKSEIEWHILKNDPDDLPGNEEPIIVTVESSDGNRRTYLDVYMKYVYNNDRYVFCNMAPDPITGEIVETLLWSPVIAWAYPPAPFTYF